MNELYHHGILGQRWGKQNGPPYPLDGKVSSKIQKAGKKRKDAEYRRQREKQKSGKNVKTEGFYDPETGEEIYVPTQRDQRKLYKAISRSKNRNKVTRAISKVTKRNPIDRQLDKVMSKQQKEDIRNHIEENEQVRKDWLATGKENGFNSKQAKEALHDYWKSSQALNKEIDGYVKTVLGKYRHKKVVGMRNGHKAYMGEAEMFVKNRIRTRAVQESYRLQQIKRMQELLEQEDDYYE
ncbi:MAG: hypothetical protein J6Y02_00895 [Pseudobutyrivibrio sp.]|nr:hypothetical protein [Pseudobutyrivibrio sp.]